MALPLEYISLMLELQKINFRSKTFETLDEVFDKYSLSYFIAIFKKRRANLFHTASRAFDKPEDFQSYLTSIFLYHPQIKRSEDLNKINIGFIDPKDKVNQACFVRHRSHLEQLELGLINDLLSINFFAQREGKSFEDVLRGSDIFFLIKEYAIRYETVAILEKVHPFLIVVFANLTKIERTEYEFVYRRVRKLALLLDLTDIDIRRYEKLIIDTKNRM
jgi:hypothetical protein